MTVLIFIVCIISLMIGYEIYLRKTGRKFLNVSITDKDGTVRIVRIRVGRDPDVDKLIKSMKKKYKIKDA